jgi:uncharacterized protein
MITHPDRRPRIPSCRVLLSALVVALGVSQTSVPAAGRSFLWKATNARGSLYLVGSVHVLSKDYYPLSPALEAAFKESDLLVEEADLGDMLTPEALMSTASRGMLPEDQTLEKVLKPSTYALVRKRVDELGLPAELLAHFKPWMIAVTLEALEWQKAGFDANLGLDKHFYDRAKSNGKAVQGLETVEYQLSRFDEMTLEQQDHLLAQTLKDIDSERGAVSQVADAWKNGDAPAVERIVLRSLKQDPVIYQRLLVERNRSWMPKLEALVGRSRPFVVVGAAHLVGPDGLLAMLKAKGYQVEQL